MTEQNYPITPPRKLVQQWSKKGYGLPDTIFFEYVANCSAQWGFDQAKADIKRERQEAADQELEACIEVIADHGWFANPEHRMAELRAARRPKPPSLKEQALETLQRLSKEFPCRFQEDAPWDIIRRALESIPDPS
jgi:hypothetical protein